MMIVASTNTALTASYDLECLQCCVFVDSY